MEVGVLFSIISCTKGSFSQMRRAVSSTQWTSTALHPCPPLAELSIVQQCRITLCHSRTVSDVDSRETVGNADEQFRTTFASGGVLSCGNMHATVHEKDIW